MKDLATKSIAIIGLFLLLAAASVQAQTPMSAEVNVPFDFSAGKATLKAGAYRIKKRAGNVLAITSADGKRTTLLDAPLAIGSRGFKSGSRLVFNRYDDQYFLSQVWLSVDAGRQLFTSGAESRAAREYNLAKKNAKPERMEVAVSKR
jgi:hypothetical protein